MLVMTYFFNLDLIRTGFVVSQAASQMPVCAVSIGRKRLAVDENSTEFGLDLWYMTAIQGPQNYCR